MGASRLRYFGSKEAIQHGVDLVKVQLLRVAFKGNKDTNHIDLATPAEVDRSHNPVQSMTRHSLGGVGTCRVALAMGIFTEVDHHSRARDRRSLSSLMTMTAPFLTSVTTWTC